MWEGQVNNKLKRLMLLAPWSRAHEAFRALDGLRALSLECRPAQLAGLACSLARFAAWWAAPASSLLPVLGRLLAPPPGPPPGARVLRCTWLSVRSSLAAVPAGLLLAAPLRTAVVGSHARHCSQHRSCLAASAAARAHATSTPPHKENPAQSKNREENGKLGNTKTETLDPISSLKT